MIDAAVLFSPSVAAAAAAAGAECFYCSAYPVPWRQPLWLAAACDHALSADTAGEGGAWTAPSTGLAASRAADNLQACLGALLSFWHSDAWQQTVLDGWQHAAMQASRATARQGMLHGCRLGWLQITGLVEDSHHAVGKLPACSWDAAVRRAPASLLCCCNAAALDIMEACREGTC